LIVLSAIGFLALALAFVGLYWVVGNAEKRRIRARLKSLSPLGVALDEAPSFVLEDKAFSAVPLLDALLSQLPLARRLHLLLVQGGTKMRLDAFLLLILGLGMGGVAVPVTLFGPKPLFLLGAALGAGPIALAHRRKVQRIKHFERLFPDALDILTGALRAGMALSGAVQVVSEECSDPVAKEFTLLFEETRLGIAMDHALRNLADRVDSKELHLFVIAVLLQRETGGNLTEILEQTAEVIRDRLRILGDVRAMTGQARLSGMILSILPLALGAFIMATAPDYMDTMIEEPAGRMMLMTAAILQVVGFFIMRRIADIKV
ncbi:MAG TPA: type II secretion system F family protein, partial [Vicinamibacteria bacterium]